MGKGRIGIPASASLLKLADQVTNVDPSLGPVVTAWHRMVEMTEV